MITASIEYAAVINACGCPRVVALVEEASTRRDNYEVRPAPELAHESAHCPSLGGL